MMRKIIIHPKLLNKKGFTLIELLIAASLSVILMGIATYGLSIIVQANQKGEAKSLTRTNLNRALEFITDEIKTAKTVSSSATWAWTDLGGGSPSGKLYLEIPLNIESIDAANDTIKITNHKFSNKDAITLRGDNAALTQLSPALSPNPSNPNPFYCVIKSDNDNIKLATSVSPKSDACENIGTAIDLTSNSIGQIGINRLVIYYMRDSTDTWLKRKTINRSTSACGGSECWALVDSIAIKDKDTSTQDGFNINQIDPRVVRVNITGQLTDDATPLPNDTEKVSTKVFARSDSP